MARANSSDDSEWEVSKTFANNYFMLVGGCEITTQDIILNL